MELKGLTDKVRNLLEIDDMSQMSEKLMETVTNDDHRIYNGFLDLVENDLTVDWLQMIFQYHQADRKEKKQDYTPPELAKFLAKRRDKMLKDTTISILIGIVIAQQITPPGHPARAAVILIIAGMVFKTLRKMENLWDKRVRIRQGVRRITSTVFSGLRQILRQTCSRIRWWRIRLRTYPAELAQRSRRRQMMSEYVQRLRSLPLEKRGRNLEESEA